jgi:ketosteroid isomerase-like protein/predicted aspartyl protease
MRVNRLYRLLMTLWLPFLLMAMPFPTRAQEIPLKHCDALPVVEVGVGDQPMLFLVDTAATSMLNLNSFTSGKAQGTRVTSWTGTLATSGRQVTLDEVTVGNTKLVKLEMLAIDLSAIGKACGRKIDGVLGMDLLAKLGATIDMKRQLMHVATASEVRGHAAAAEMMGEMHRCLDAFNESDEKTFAECLDPKIVLFTAGAELYGREQTLGYFRERYFHQKPAARLEITESAFHPIGDAIWYEYEFAIESTRGVLRGRGMAMCRKSEGRWRMASMHHSIVEFEPAVAEGQSR